MAEEEMIIKPPPSMKALCDKTAEFVARVGPSFEARVYSKEKNNPDYAFLMPANHYNAYYKQLVQKFKDQNAKPVISDEAAPLPPTRKQWKDRSKQKNENDQQQEEEPPAAPEVELIEPEQQNYVLDIPPLTSALTLARVKLCARGIALNGESFRVALENEHRGQRDFDFMKKSSILNKMFESLIVSYKRVLSDTDGELLTDCKSHASALGRVLKRVQWERAERAKAKIAEIRARMEDHMDLGAAVDWSDFVVVQQIDFRESPQREIILKGKKTQLRTTLIDVGDAVLNLRSQGIQLHRSYDPGRFLCNYLYFLSLARSSRRTLFVHVPSFAKVELSQQLHFVRLLLIEIGNQQK